MGPRIASVRCFALARYHVIVAPGPVVVIDKDAAEVGHAQAVGYVHGRHTMPHCRVSNNRIPTKHIRIPAGADHVRPAGLSVSTVGCVPAPDGVERAVPPSLAQVVGEGDVEHVIPGEHGSRQLHQRRLIV